MTKRIMTLKISDLSKTPQNTKSTTTETETSNISKTINRNPCWCIWTQSYDRGLEHLLKMWPDVKKAVPKAELHIFYGWRLFDQFYKNNPGSMAWKKRMIEMMKADGVTDHGRVPQPELKKWYQKCGLWTYPTHFGEISCISAMKAQAWGALPVYIKYAALETTVSCGFPVKGDIYEKEVFEKYKEHLIWVLKISDPDHPKGVLDNTMICTPFTGKKGEGIEKYRKQMMKVASEGFKWEHVAKQWSDEFESHTTTG